MQISPVNARESLQCSKGRIDIAASWQKRAIVPDDRLRNPATNTHV